MVQEHRNKRLRRLISQLNKTRRLQAQKIDILCNDIVAAHRDFIKQLQVLCFAAEFYESLVGQTDIDTVLCTAADLIKQAVCDSSIALFLLESNGFQIHMFQTTQPIIVDTEQLKNCFTSELVGNICNSNKVCFIDDMFGMGLGGNLTALNKISAAAIPLHQIGPPIGFILIYRSAENKLASEELEKIAAVTSGLSRSIKSCQVLSHPADLV